jgi:hypothetical protein
VIIAHCSNENATTDEYGGAIRLQIKSAKIMDCSFTRCFSWGDSGAGSGGAIWSDSISTIVQRCCGVACGADGYGLFVKYGGTEEASFEVGTLFACGTNESGFECVGQGSVCGDSAPLWLTNVNFTACAGMAGAAVTIAGASCIGLATYLVVTGCASGSGIDIGVNCRSCGSSWIDQSIFVDGQFSRAAVQLLGGEVQVDHCCFYNNSVDLACQVLTSGVFVIKRCYFNASGEMYQTAQYTNIGNQWMATRPAVPVYITGMPTCVTQPLTGLFTRSNGFSLTAAALEGSAAPGRSAEAVNLSADLLTRAPDRSARPLQTGDVTFSVQRETVPFDASDSGPQSGGYFGASPAVLGSPHLDQTRQPFAFSVWIPVVGVACAVAVAVGVIVYLRLRRQPPKVEENGNEGGPTFGEQIDRETEYRNQLSADDGKQSEDEVFSLGGGDESKG